LFIRHGHVVGAALRPAIILVREFIGYRPDAMIIVGGWLLYIDRNDTMITAKRLTGVAEDTQVRVKGGRPIVVLGGVDRAGGADADATLGPYALRREGNLPKEMISDFPSVGRGQSIHRGKQHPPRRRNLLVAVSLWFAIHLKTRHQGDGGPRRTFAENREQFAPGYGGGLEVKLVTVMNKFDSLAGLEFLQPCMGVPHASQDMPVHTIAAGTQVDLQSLGKD
jgi:hypothetical protein